ESPDIRHSGLHRLLAEPPAGEPGTRWVALGGLYSFGAQRADLRLLGWLGAVGRVLDAPFIAAADPRLAGCESIDWSADPSGWAVEPDPGWQGLRRMPEALWIGLALPRFLLRLPYGERGSRCETLAFEELFGSPAHGDYLWGNPALVCLALLAQAIADGGRPVFAGMNLEVDSLPFHVVPHPDGAIPKPCAEALLSEPAIDRLIDRGLMALASIRD